MTVPVLLSLLPEGAWLPTWMNPYLSAAIALAFIVLPLATALWVYRDATVRAVGAPELRSGDRVLVSPSQLWGGVIGLIMVANLVVGFFAFVFYLVVRPPVAGPSDADARLAGSSQ